MNLYQYRNYNWKFKMLTEVRAIKIHFLSSIQVFYKLLKNYNLLNCKIINL